MIDLLIASVCFVVAVVIVAVLVGALASWFAEWLFGDDDADADMDGWWW